MTVTVEGIQYSSAYVYEQRNAAHRAFCRRNRLSKREERWSRKAFMRMPDYTGSESEVRSQIESDVRSGMGVILSTILPWVVTRLALVIFSYWFDDWFAARQAAKATS